MIYLVELIVEVTQVVGLAVRSPKFVARDGCAPIRLIIVSSKCWQRASTGGAQELATDESHR
jgi:hypothetical protein